MWFQSLACYASQAYLEDLDDTLDLEGSRSSSHLGYEYVESTFTFQVC